MTLGRAGAPGRITLRPIEPAEVFGGFTCGTRPGAVEIDTYLHTQSTADHAAKLSAVWVAIDAFAVDPELRLLGFFTLSPLSIPISPSLTAFIKLSATPYPAVGGYLIGRLGVASHQQGQQFGDVLVFAAIQRARLAGINSAGAFVAVDPKNDQLVEWYERLGFNRLDLHPKKRRMVFRL